MDNCGTKHYKRLMMEFGRVVRVFRALDTGFQDVIADITKRMGNGMADYIEIQVRSGQLRSSRVRSGRRPWQRPWQRAPRRAAPVCWPG